MASKLLVNQKKLCLAMSSRGGGERATSSCSVVPKEFLESSLE